MPNTATIARSTRTFHRVEYRPADGVKGWQKIGQGTVSLALAMDKLRDYADQMPGVNWRVASGSAYGDSRSPLVVHAVRGAV